MNKIEKQFKSDFEKANKINLTFDTSKLEPNEKKVKVHKPFPWKVVIPVGCGALTLGLIIAGCAAFVNAFLMKDSGVQTKRMRLSMNEISIAKSNTFKPINTVSYPDGTEPQKSDISESEMNAYNNFANETYQSLVKTSKKDNMTYSPIGIYSVLNEMYGSISRSDLEDRFNALLGLNETERVSFYNKVMLANSFASDENTIQLKNAAFFKSGYNYNTEYVNKLTKLYTQAYTCDFNNSKDINKMLEWANDAVKAKNFIDKDFLEIDSQTMLVWFSTLFFKNAWANKYLSKQSAEGDFYLTPEQTKKVTYMYHSYFTDKYYDYEDYISFRDYYLYGYASVTYIVPKYYEDNIFELTKNVNIFEDKEENVVLPTPCEDDDYCYRRDEIEVRLSTPKFRNSTEFDFKNTINDLGLGDMYTSSSGSFNNAFDDSRLSETPIGLDALKQKNEVEFNEDGSVVRSISVGFGEAMSAAPMESDVLEVKLDQPFIYIIRDTNDIPIFVGHIDNPTY